MKRDFGSAAYTAAKGVLLQGPFGRRLRKTLLNKRKDFAWVHLENRLVHAAWIYLVFFLIGRCHAIESSGGSNRSGFAFDNDGFLTMIVCDRASGISCEVLALARFAAGREKESIVEPDSPDRHHMRARQSGAFAGINRSQPVGMTAIHLAGNPRPGEETCAVVGSEDSITGSEGTGGFGASVGACRLARKVTGRGARFRHDRHFSAAAKGLTTSSAIAFCLGLDTNTLNYRGICIIIDIINYMRVTKSFTIDPDITEYVAETKGQRSASERVNELLRRAIMEEQYERLEAEAKAFYGAAGAKERRETRAFQRAAIETFRRD